MRILDRIYICSMSSLEQLAVHKLREGCAESIHNTTYIVLDAHIGLYAYLPEVKHFLSYLKGRNLLLKSNLPYSTYLLSTISLHNAVLQWEGTHSQASSASYSRLYIAASYTCILGLFQLCIHIRVYFSILLPGGPIGSVGN